MLEVFSEYGDGRPNYGGTFQVMSYPTLWRYEQQDKRILSQVSKRKAMEIHSTCRLCPSISLSSLMLFLKFPYLKCEMQNSRIALGQIS